MGSLKACPDNYVFGLDIGTRSIVGTVGYREDEKKFRVVGQVVRMHDTRSMLDGQIHDIDKVAETISHVKSDLEELLSIKLEKVCIAAAGRVLRTVTVRAEVDLGQERIIDGECLHTLELTGMELAYDTMKKGMHQNINMYCVGSTVVHYYLDDYLMLSLEGHKGKKIAADFLATFLPDEVVDSLYSAVERAGLSVANITLEPIAACEVAIPINYRLLNIALVDVGAGTSDICITKDGSIIGYGMIPTAGDTFTEEIAKLCLVDFNGAEKIKMSCSTKKTVSYKDIMGVTRKIASSELIGKLEDKINSSSKLVAEKIIELNGGLPVSAVFIVGGGGKIPGFSEKLAEHLQLPKERVAVRGSEVFEHIIFEQESIVLDSTLVTPVGICLTYLNKNNSFIMVSVNGRQIKMYDNSKLTVMDAAIQIGFPKDNLFPKRGAELRYWVNNEARMVRGEAGEGAKITVNGKAESFNARIEADDIIEIIPSTAGEDAKKTIGDLPEFKRKGQIEIEVNGSKVICPRMVLVNGEVALAGSQVKQEDKIEILDYYMISQVLEVMDMPEPVYFSINGKESDWKDRIYEGFQVECDWSSSQDGWKTVEEEVASEVSRDTGEATSGTPINDNGVSPDNELLSSDTLGKEEPVQLEEKDMSKGQEEKEEVATGNNENAFVHDIGIILNGQPLVLSGKKNYLFVDILDVHPFDISKAGASTLVQKVNGMIANFSTPVEENDVIELYWK